MAWAFEKVQQQCLKRRTSSACRKTQTPGLLLLIGQRQHHDFKKEKRETVVP